MVDKVCPFKKKVELRGTSYNGATRYDRIKEEFNYCDEKLCMAFYTDGERNGHCRRLESNSNGN